MTIVVRTTEDTHRFEDPEQGYSIDENILFVEGVMFPLYNVVWVKHIHA